MHFVNQSFKQSYHSKHNKVLLSPLRTSCNRRFILTLLSSFCWHLCTSSTSGCTFINTSLASSLSSRNVIITIFLFLNFKSLSVSKCQENKHIYYLIINYLCSKGAIRRYTEFREVFTFQNGRSLWVQHRTSFFLFCENSINFIKR